MKQEATRHMNIVLESAKRKMDSQPQQTEVSRGLKWERKRSSQPLTTYNLLSPEHDKDRGTRQKIDEPPTPYSYYPYEVDNDSMSIHSSDPSSSAKLCKELPDEVDYNSDCEFLNEAEKIDHHSRRSRDTRCESSSHMTVSGMIPIQVHNSSAQVSDNWETLQAKLSHQKQLQDRAACSSSSSGDNTNKTESRLGIELSSSPLRVSGPAIWNCSDQNQGQEMFKDVAEHGDFKNKRAAHYNEYKLVQAMKCRQQQEEEEEEEEDGHGN